MGRIFAYTTAGTIIGLAVLYVSFRQAGIDLLSPAARTTALLCVVTAFYVSLRVSMLVSRFLERRADQRNDGGSDGRGTPGEARRANPFSRWGRSSALDSRMAERRARVARAKARQSSAKEAAKADGGEREPR